MALANDGIVTGAGWRAWRTLVAMALCLLALLVMLFWIAPPP